MENTTENKHPSLHVTVGVYSNGQFKTNTVADEDLQNHIEYNKVMRFGRALFVDGECVYAGYLSPERVEEWTEKLREMNLQPASYPTRPYQ